MQKIKITKRQKNHEKEFKFTASWLGEYGPCKVYGTLTINYLKKNYCYTDGSLMISESKRVGAMPPFKEWGKVGIGYQKMFDAAKSFAKKELAKVKK